MREDGDTVGGRFPVLFFLSEFHQNFSDGLSHDVSLNPDTLVEWFLSVHNDVSLFVCPCSLSRQWRFREREI